MASLSQPPAASLMPNLGPEALPTESRGQTQNDLAPPRALTGTVGAVSRRQCANSAASKRRGVVSVSTPHVWCILAAISLLGTGGCAACRFPTEREIQRELIALSTSRDSAFERRAAGLLNRVGRADEAEQTYVASRVMSDIVEVGIAAGQEQEVLAAFEGADLDGLYLEMGCGAREGLLQRSPRARQLLAENPELLRQLTNSCDGLAFVKRSPKDYAFDTPDASF